MVNNKMNIWIQCRKCFVMIMTVTMLLQLTGCRSDSAADVDLGSLVQQDIDTSDTEVEETIEDVTENQVASSYNVYLYASGSLNETITADSFGYNVSAYTDNADRRLLEGSFEPVPVQFSEEAYKEFVNRMNQHDVSYVYEDLYDMEKAAADIQQYEEALAGKIHRDLITSIDDIPTEEQIRSQIYENSERFLQEHDGYQQLDPEYTELIAQILADRIRDSYELLSEEDRSRIYCMLNDVSAVGIDSTDFTVNDLKQVYNARVTDDAVVMLDTEMMQQLRGEQIAERTIVHEVAHLFQRMCPDHRIPGLTQIGSSRYVEAYDENGGVNSLHYQWLYEAAAEFMSMNAFAAKTPLVYQNMVGYLHTLNLITLLQPEFDENSITVSQMSTDPQSIYEIFKAETEEEKREIAAMLFSICYIQNDREDFTGAYEAVNGSIEGQETTVKMIMKESVVQTMTKYFYKHLAERICNSEVVLQDVFYLINVFEAALNRHVLYEEAQRLEYNDESMAFYLETQDQFFEALAVESGMRYEELIESFGEYALLNKKGNDYQRNYQFSWLDDEEKEYIGTVLTTNIGSLTVNIRDVELYR